MMIPQPTRGGSPAALPEAGPLSESAGSTVRNVLLSDEKLSLIDRRRILWGLAGLGAVAGVVTTASNAAKVKLTREVAADPYQMAQQTSASLTRLRGDFSRLAADADAIAEAHKDLFLRTVSVSGLRQYWETYTETYSCTGSDGKPSTCTRTAQRLVTAPYSRSNSEYIDDGMKEVKSGYLSEKDKFLSTQSRQADALETQGLMEIEGSVTDRDWKTASGEEFAEHFGFTWQDGQVNGPLQGVLAFLLGGAGASALLFYGQVLDRAAERNRSSYGYYNYSEIEAERRQRDEVGLTRRALFQFAFGAAAAAVGLQSQKHYDERSRRIMGEAESAIRGIVVAENGKTVGQLYQEFFNADPATVIAAARDLSAKLGRVGFAEVSESIRAGIKEMKRTDFGVSAPYDAISQSWSYEDDYSEKAIGDYVAAAHRLSVHLSDTADDLEAFFANGVPQELLPLLRAIKITDGVNDTVRGEHVDQVLGLSWDISKLYLLAGFLIGLSEIPGPHQKASYAAVQGTFDFIDYFRMPIGQKMQELKDWAESARLSKMAEEPEIKALVAGHLEALKRSAKDFAEMGVIHGRSFDGHEFKLDEGKLNAEDIVKVYIDKAMASFVQRHSSFAGLKKALLSTREGGANFHAPDEAEFRETVREMIRNADVTFVFDMIEAGILDDEEPDETWLTAESGDLQKLIGFWADKISSFVAASTIQLVALDILPKSWWDHANRKIRVLTRDEIVSAFEAAVVEEELGDAKKVAKAKKELRGQFGDAVSGEEMSRRLILKRLQMAATSQKELELLRTHCPALREALG